MGMSKWNSGIISGIIAGGIGAAGLGAAGLSYAFTDFLMKMALNRKMPKLAENAFDHIAGHITENAFFQKLAETSEKLKKAPSEEISITASDGTRLVGHWIPAEQPERIVIAMHGWRNSWHDTFGMVADSWKRFHCSVLYAEQRGQNKSGGDYMGFGLTERYDCVDWANWAVRTHGHELPIYLAGVSMGATTVLLASELNLPEEVHGIQADCGFTSPNEIWKHVVQDNLHLNYKPVEKLAEFIYRRKTKEPTDRYSTEEALQKTDIPVLFVHGSDDHFVPAAMTMNNYKACASPKSLLIVSGADHGASYFTDQNAYEKAVQRFWKKYDHYDRKKSGEYPVGALPALS